MTQQTDRIRLIKPSLNELPKIIQVLSEWQQDGDVIQLHPGDLGWFSRFGEHALIEAIRIWIKDTQVVAIGLLDTQDLIRIAINPKSEKDSELFDHMVHDLSYPNNEIFASGSVYIEARSSDLFRQKLLELQWDHDQAWTSFSRDLSEPVQDSGLHVEVVTSELAHLRCKLQRSSFDNSTFSKENWHKMSQGSIYANAKCLIGYNEEGKPVASCTVWSAGTNKPGLIEPLGVDKQYRSKGYGTAITLASASILREMGASSAVVCTAKSNVGGVSTYRSAGFKELPETRDLHKEI